MAGASTGKTFVGFGFGPIQSALFLYEARLSGNFDRYVVVDIDRELVEAVRAGGGSYTVNIARPDRVDRFTVEGVEIYDPREAGEASRILQAVAGSDELCTALPSVRIYGAGGRASVASLLAGGLAARRRSFPTIVYTAENNNRAAEILAAELEKALPERSAASGQLQVLNTVIGKMSGVIAEPDTIRRLALAPITPRIPRAVLVEEFNRILISRIELPGYRRGIEVFQEKPDLLPFEEAKLYGHNAVHALIAYLADLRGYRTIAEAGADGQIMSIAREAFIEESGAALVRRHAALGDPLFTEEGYREYAEDLLARMVNPNLNDLVERVGRDHLRKLAAEDRLYGTMTIALQQGLEPRRLALGAAAAVVCLMRRRENLHRRPELSLPQDAGGLTPRSLERFLRGLWGEGESGPRHGERLAALTWEGLGELRRRGFLS